MATNVLGLKTFTASDPVDYNDVNDNYVKIDNGVKTAMQGRAAHNLLDNSDFRNPVNQRGAITYEGAGYGIDRWKCRVVLQTMEVRSSDITITATGGSYAGILQKVENMSKLAGKTVTFAAKIYSNVAPELVFFDASGQTLALKIGITGATQTIILTYDVPSDATADSVVPTILLRTSASGDYMRIYWAALYEGAYTVDTLPAYVPKGHAAELAECMRYYQVIPYDLSVYNVATDSAYPSRYPILFPQRMRITPTATLNESWNSNVKTSETSYVSANGLCFTVSANSTGYTEWHGSITLSADL